MRIPRRTCVRLAIVAYATGGGTDSGTEKAEPQRFWPLLPFKRCAAPVLASKTEDRLLKRKVTKWKRCTFEAFVPRFQRVLTSMRPSKRQLALVATKKRRQQLSVGLDAPAC